MLASPATLFSKYPSEMFDSVDAAWYNCNYAAILT